jgi:hypothetical protein
MTSPEFQKLAKQGDLSAIAHLMNHALFSHRIQVASVRIQAESLNIVLKAERSPIDSRVYEMLDRGIAKLAIPGVKRVQIKEAKPKQIEQKPIEPVTIEPRAQKALAKWLPLDSRLYKMLNQGYANAYAKGASSPIKSEGQAMTAQEFRKELNRSRRNRQGDAQGCGCLLILLGIFAIMTIIFAPFGGLFILIGFIVLVVSFFV